MGGLARDQTLNVTIAASNLVISNTISAAYQYGLTPGPTITSTFLARRLVTIYSLDSSGQVIWDATINTTAR